MRALLLFVLGLIVGCAGAPRDVPQVPRSVHAAQLIDETVALVLFDEDDGITRPYCAGVWVGDAYILTAWHCVDDLLIGDEVRFSVYSDVYANDPFASPQAIRSRSSRLNAQDEEHDLALLRTSGSVPHAVARLGDGPVYAGDFAQMVGHPRGLWWSYSSGDVSSVRRLDADLDIVWIQSTAPTSPGNSGGGLFDADGRLIGICSRGFSPSKAQNLNLFVHGQYIADFLKKVHLQ